MKNSHKPIFVVQKHKARTQHYDFRIEIGGMLVSWAVPKGPSTDPRLKRLAVRTGDHPLDWVDFEGVIPEGRPGAGTVIVWDRGSYRNILAFKDKSSHRSMEQSLEEGVIEIELDGEKLKGGYALIRTRRSYGRRENWLLVKMTDATADSSSDIREARPESIISGKTIEEIEG